MKKTSSLSNSERNTKWQRFARNPRAFTSLLLLTLIFILSFTMGFFLPSPSEVTDPATIQQHQRIKIKVAPELKLCRIDLRPDFTLASEVGLAVFFPDRKKGQTPFSKEQYPRQIVRGIEARFQNLDSEGVTELMTSNLDDTLELQLLPFKHRSSPPKTVRLRIRQSETTVTRTYNLVFEKNNGILKPIGKSKSLLTKINSELSSGTIPDSQVVVFKDGTKANISEMAETIAWPFRPVPGHILGIDSAGRDVLARIVAGTRIALIFGLVLVISSMAIGVMIGAIQGYYGATVDIISQRFIEIWSSLPFLYVMILIGSVLGRSFTLLLISYGLFNWIGISYYIRAEFLRLRSRPFVELSKVNGLSSWHIIWHHILPNSITPIVTLLPFSLIGAISSISALDFLGFGLPPLTPSLGELLYQAGQTTSAWWLALYPSIVLFVIMLLAVFIGEGLRDAFDPKPTARYK